MKRYLFLLFLLIPVFGCVNNSAYVYNYSYEGSFSSDAIIFDFDDVIDDGLINNVSDIASWRGTGYNRLNTSLAYNNTNQTYWEFGILSSDPYNTYDDFASLNISWADLDYDYRRNFTFNATHWQWDDMEDGTVADWTLFFGSVFSWTAASDANTINGTYSARMSNNLNGGYRKSIPSSTEDGLMLSFNIPVDVGDSLTYWNPVIQNSAGGGSFTWSLRFKHGSNDISVWTGASDVSTGFTWSAGFVHHLIFLPEWGTTTKTYDIWFWDDNSTWQQIANDFSMNDQTSVGWDQFQHAHIVNTGTPQVYLDDLVFYSNNTIYNITINHGGNITDSGTYVVYNHTSGEQLDTFTQTHLGSDTVDFDVSTYGYPYEIFDTINYTIYYANNTADTDHSTAHPYSNVNYTQDQVITEYDFESQAAEGDFTVINVQVSDLVQINNFFNVSFFYEANNTLLDNSYSNNTLMKVTCDLTEDEVYMDGQYMNMIVEEDLTYITAFFSSGGLDYTRRQVPTFGDEDLKLYWLDHGDNELFLVTLQLVTDDVPEWGGAEIELSRNYPDARYIVTSDIAQVDGTALFYLNSYSVYYLSINGATETRSLGFFTPQETGTRLIDLREVAYTEGIDNPYSDVHYNFSRSDTFLNFNFYDQGNSTSNVTWHVYRSNGDLLYYYTDNENKFTWTFDLNVFTPPVSPVENIIEDFEDGAAFIGDWTQVIASADGFFTATTAPNTTINGTYSGNYTVLNAGQYAWRTDFTATTERLRYYFILESASGTNEYTRVDFCETTGCSVDTMLLVYHYQFRGINILGGSGIQTIIPTNQVTLNVPHTIEIIPHYNNNTFDIEYDGENKGNYPFRNDIDEIGSIRINAVSSGGSYSLIVDNFAHWTEQVPGFYTNYANDTLITGFTAFSSTYGEYVYNTTFLFFDQQLGLGTAPDWLDEEEISRGVLLLLTAFLLVFTFKWSGYGTIITWLITYFLWVAGFFPMITNVHIGYLLVYAIGAVIVQWKRGGGK